MEYYRYPQAGAFNASGQDAERYLQNRLTQNIRAQSNLSILPSAMTDPQSKLEALFSVIKTSPTNFTLVTRSGDSASQFSNLKRFQVADRLQISEIQAAKLYFLRGARAQQFIEQVLLQAAPQTPNQVIQQQDTFCWRCCDGWEILTSFDLSELVNLGTELSEDELLKFRFKHNLPLLEHEIATGTPLMNTGLKSHIGFGAGCYVGQEVIEKVDARGKAPFKLVRLTVSSTSVQAEDVVYLFQDQTWKPAGKILSCVEINNNTTWAFAQIKNIDYQEVKVGDYPAKEFVENLPS